MNKIKSCTDADHVGARGLDMSEFYESPRTADGRIKVCITCHKRRATEGVYRRRAERQLLGLPCRATADEVAERSAATYLHRHIARREQEAAIQHAEGNTTVTVDEMVLCSTEQNNPCNWVGLINGFLRKGKARPSFSRA